MAVVKIDRGSGKVAVERYLIAYDVGRAVNPMMIEGQIAGGFAQGLGGALLSPAHATAPRQRSEIRENRMMVHPRVPETIGRVAPRRRWCTSRWCLRRPSRARPLSGV